LYLINEILVFSPGRRQEGLDRLGWIHSLMQPNPGFIQALVGRYQGDSFRHTVLRLWESAEAFQKFRETPDANYGRNRPEGLYVNEPVVPRWESFLEADGNAKGDFLLKVQLEVPDEAWEARVGQLKELQNAAIATGAVVSARNFRATDQSQSLSLVRWESRDAFERFVDSPDYAKANATMPDGVKLIRREFFEVVSEVLPK
jgi:heme-degrading monooxygenase HmoA